MRVRGTEPLVVYGVMCMGRGVGDAVRVAGPLRERLGPGRWLPALVMCNWLLCNVTFSSYPNRADSRRCKHHAGDGFNVSVS